MAISPAPKRLRTYQPDRLSHLPEALLLTILSLLPTRVAARTSVLSRRFRHLWEASPSLDLIPRHLPEPQYRNFSALADRLLFNRDPSHSLLSLRLSISGTVICRIRFVRSLLAMVASLSLRHLTIERCIFCYIQPTLPAIFSMESLESLSLPSIAPFYPYYEKNYTLPSASLTRLTSLTIKKFDRYFSELNQILSQLPSLEELNLGVRTVRELTLSSQTIKKLKLKLFPTTRPLRILGLSLPLLESFHLKNRGAFRVPIFQGQIRSLKKAVHDIDFILKKDASAVDGLLDCVSHAEELILRIKESEDEKDPFCILWDSDKKPPNFPKLKNLKVSMCFHEYNFEAIISMLHHCPALESVRLIHKLPKFTAERARSAWKSMLPQNAHHNFCYVFFKNLHLGENRKEFLKSLRNVSL